MSKNQSPSEEIDNSLKNQDSDHVILIEEETPSAQHPIESV